MSSWEFSALCEGSSIFGKIYFKLSTLSQALHSYLPYLSDRELYCSPLFLKNCVIFEKIRTKICETVRTDEATVSQRETLWNWVTHSETVRVEMSATMKFAVFTQRKKFLFVSQLDIISYLDSSLCFLYQQSYFANKSVNSGHLKNIFAPS